MQSPCNGHEKSLGWWMKILRPYYAFSIFLPRSQKRSENAIVSDLGHEQMNNAPIDLGPYLLTRPLGNGTTSKVQLAINQVTKEEVAIKIISKQTFETKPNLAMKTQREIALMQLVDHPHLLKLLDVLESPRHLYIVLEYANRGELFDYLVEHRQLPEEQGMRFFRQIIFGLEHLHSLGICHRDLKPENILLDKDLNIKIADFGYARFVRTSIAETSCGSPHYAAPEVIKGEPYDGRKADVWSCGVILYALLAGFLPFDDRNIRVLLQKVRAGVYQMPPFSDPMRNLISRMLTIDPEERISVAEIKLHPAFRLGMPMDYIFPTPLPLPSVSDPIPPEAISSEFIDLLHKIGYTDDEELAVDLTQPGHTMAKVFYHILTKHNDIDSIQWDTSVGGLLADETFMMSPPTHAFAVSGTDPFHRHLFQGGQSLEMGNSLTNRAEWAIQPEQDMQTLQIHDIVTLGPPERAMYVMQGLMRQFSMQWFHPDDFHIVCRHEGMGMYLTITCQLTEPMTIRFQLIRGQVESFATICHAAEDLVFASLNG